MSRYQTESLFGAGDVPEEGCGHIASVAFEAGVDNEFDYLVPEKLWPVAVGQRVEVPVGRSNKRAIGFCVGVREFSL